MNNILDLMHECELTIPPTTDRKTVMRYTLTTKLLTKMDEKKEMKMTKGDLTCRTKPIFQLLGRLPTRSTASHCHSYPWGIHNTTIDGCLSHS